MAYTNVITNPFPAAIPPVWMTPTAQQITDMQSAKTSMSAPHHIGSVFQYLLHNFPARWHDNGIDVQTVHYNFRSN